MPAPVTSSELLELLRKSGVVTPSALRTFLDRHTPLTPDPKTVAKQLIQLTLITTFQAKLLLAGRYKGFRLGSYKLLDQIGQGGMGAVYLAEHETRRGRVAIKVLPPGGNKITIERFLREARSAAALDHPNIVRLVDSGLEGNIHFLVMEYVAGRTLDKVVEDDGPLSAESTVAYMVQAAAGLQHAYLKGLIHRDIKPGNLILTADGVVKILDMGLARSGDESDMLTDMLDAGSVVGTADYISPEQASNAADIDIRTDLYSLGATFFAVVAGRPLFEGSVANKLLQHQLEEPPSLCDVDQSFPPKLAAIVSKLLKKSPADRYQTPAKLIEALDPWVKGIAPFTVMTAAVRSPSKIDGSISNSDVEFDEVPTRNMRRWYLIIAILFLMLVVAAGVMITLFQRNGSAIPQSTDDPHTESSVKTAME